MDAGLVNAASNASAQDVAPLLMLKKALNIQANSTLSLLDALPQVSATNNPPNLGQNVDVKA
ncbi:YjfB family protein [Chitinibacter fontanus]|uniref:YjfB family protein n=1 Tax=Chitinibacter fontanus TaxID=1737446 RepID=A0A7D5V709_9NEIS|nr:YjfB family protein [Chitinibacter fontanus]QLI80055.1 YjfB family protein [Chitinibacter fontanus]